MIFFAGTLFTQPPDAITLLIPYYSKATVAVTWKQQFLDQLLLFKKLFILMILHLNQKTGYFTGIYFHKCSFYEILRIILFANMQVVKKSCKFLVILKDTNKRTIHIYWTGL